MNLPKEIEAEMRATAEAFVVSQQLDGDYPEEPYPDDFVEAVDEVVETMEAVARIVAEDCAQTCDDDFEQKAIRARYGLDEQKEGE